MLAKLVEEQKLTWDTPVTILPPTFRLGDAETTRQVNSPVRFGWRLANCASVRFGWRLANSTRSERGRRATGGPPLVSGPRQRRAQPTHLGQFVNAVRDCLVRHIHARAKRIIEARQPRQLRDASPDRVFRHVNGKRHEIS